MAYSLQAASQSGVQNCIEAAQVDDALGLAVFPQHNLEAVLTADHLLAYAYQKSQADTVDKCYIPEIKDEYLAFRHPLEVCLRGFIMLVKCRHRGKIKVAAGLNNHTGPNPPDMDLNRG